MSSLPDAYRSNWTQLWTDGPPVSCMGDLRQNLRPTPANAVTAKCGAACRLYQRPQHIPHHKPFYKTLQALTSVLCLESSSKNNEMV